MVPPIGGTGNGASFWRHCVPPANSPAVIGRQPIGWRRVSRLGILRNALVISIGMICWTCSSECGACSLGCDSCSLECGACSLGCRGPMQGLRRGLTGRSGRAVIRGHGESLGEAGSIEPAGMVLAKASTVWCLQMQARCCASFWRHGMWCRQLTAQYTAAEFGGGKLLGADQRRYGPGRARHGSLASGDTAPGKDPARFP